MPKTISSAAAAVSDETWAEFYVLPAAAAAAARMGRRKCEFAQCQSRHFYKGLAGETERGPRWDQRKRIAQSQCQFPVLISNSPGWQSLTMTVLNF